MSNIVKTFNHKGRDYLDIVPDRLSVEEISNQVKAAECGAISMFIGTTRDNFEGLKVVSLQYEAYISMAMKIFKDICNNLRETWPDIVNVAIYHRLGNVPVTEASVIIAVSSPHRQSSLSAVEHAINKLKELAPIWKKEEYAQGSEAQWKENAESHSLQEEYPLRIPEASDIQINSSHDEVFSNIRSFLAYRKKLNSRGNIKIFCQRDPSQRSPYSCSRVDAISHRMIATQAEGQYRKEHYDDIPTQDSNPQKSKIKQANRKEEVIDTQDSRRANSSQEPPTVESSRYLLQESSVTQHLSLPHQSNVPFGVAERLALVADHVGVAAEGSVYARLQLIEDRIMQIENDCEEYLKMKDYFKKEKSSKSLISHSPTPEHSENAKTKVFSVEDIDAKIMHLKYQLSSLARNNDESDDDDNRKYE